MPVKKGTNWWKVCILTVTGLVIVGAIVYFVLPEGFIEKNEEDVDAYVYTGRESYWYSTYLRSDGQKSATSYDYSYRNSYSYLGDNNVKQWDYMKKQWSYTYGYTAPVPDAPEPEVEAPEPEPEVEAPEPEPVVEAPVAKKSYVAPVSYYAYTGRDSTWYSSYLKWDGTGYRTSYDTSYRNSYSYVASQNVKQWNYSTNAWSYTYGYVAPPPSDEPARNCNINEKLNVRGRGRCYNGTQCNGDRTCSTSGWCQGSSNC